MNKDQINIKPILIIKYRIILATLINFLLSMIDGNSLLGMTIIFIFGFPVFSVYLYVKIKKYKATEFIIDKDKVSYIRDFIGYNRTDIRYENIKEVIVKQNPLKKLFNLGDIHLITNISSDRAGIVLFDIEHPFQIYSLLQNKINPSMIK